MTDQIDNTYLEVSQANGAALFARGIAGDIVMPHLRASGGELLFIGDGGNYLILAMLIRQSSMESFFAFAADGAYLKGIGHRDAAVVDSRILPLVKVETDNAAAHGAH